MSRPERAALPSSSFSASDSQTFQFRGLPGAYQPAQGSLLDMSLRQLAVDWEFQRSYNCYYIFALPNHLKVALLAYLARWYGSGVSSADLRAILLPWTEDPSEDSEGHDTPSPIPQTTVNVDITHLDLTNSLGHSLRLRELSDFLFPSRSSTPSQLQPQESWDAPASQTPTVPPALLPNITHLSLALDPRHAPNLSWRHLLSFAAHFSSTLTHLSLAYWPEPTLTPNARLSAATFTSPTGRTIQYGGTGPYSHSLDEDWSEAVLVLRRLARNLYGLEWLDLTGCASWALPALTTQAEHDSVDWVGDWGRVETVLLYPRFGRELLGDELYKGEVDAARRLERHVRGKRGGVGRGIAVETVDERL